MEVVDDNEFNASIEVKVWKETGEEKGDCKAEETGGEVTDCKFKMDANDDGFDVTVADNPSKEGDRRKWDRDEPLTK